VINQEIPDHFSFAMDLHEGADYGCICNEELARLIIESARTVFEMVRP
jgi:hypothetical protein